MVSVSAWRAPRRLECGDPGRREPAAQRGVAARGQAELTPTGVREAKPGAVLDDHGAPGAALGLGDRHRERQPVGRRQLPVVHQEPPGPVLVDHEEPPWPEAVAGHREPPVERLEPKRVVFARRQVHRPVDVLPPGVPASRTGSEVGDQPAEEIAPAGHQLLGLGGTSPRIVVLDANLGTVAGRGDPPPDPLYRADAEEAPVVLQQAATWSFDDVDRGEDEEVAVAELDAGGAAGAPRLVEVAEPHREPGRVTQRPPGRRERRRHGHADPDQVRPDRRDRRIHRITPPDNHIFVY